MRIEPRGQLSVWLNLTLQPIKVYLNHVFRPETVRKDKNKTLTRRPSVVITQLLVAKQTCTVQKAHSKIHKNRLNKQPKRCRASVKQFGTTTSSVIFSWLHPPRLYSLRLHLDVRSVDGSLMSVHVDLRLKRFNL